jgi:hypothetical protein
MRSAVMELLPVCVTATNPEPHDISHSEVSARGGGQCHDLRYRDDMIIRLLESLVNVVSRQKMCAKSYPKMSKECGHGR